MLFARLGVWADGVPRGGPAQMAADEMLLEAAGGPVLRFFRWAEPWISAGHFVDLEAAAAARPGLPVCRRWTGGGVVVHDGDLTFSLAVPRGEPWATLRPGESYRRLHEALAGAMRSAGIPVELASHAAAPHGECFARPVPHDIVHAGRKVAGGAQRRTRRGVLHQGSIQGAAAAPALAGLIAEALAGKTEPWPPPAGAEERIAALVAARYGREGFVRAARTGAQ